MEGESFSDHKYITFYIKSEQTDMPHVRNLKKCDWNKFKELAGTWTESDNTLNDKVNDLTKHIKNSFDVACPLRRPLNKIPVPWWSNKI